MPNVQNLPNWLLVISLVTASLYGLFTLLAHVPGLPVQWTARFARLGAFFGKLEKLCPAPEASQGNSGIKDKSGESLTS